MWFSILLTFSVHASTPFERVMLINDLETWLNGGESFIDWTEFRNGKKVIESPNGYSLVKIYYDFKRNVFAAEKEYDGKIHRTKMPFSSIERNDRGEPIIVFDVDYIHHIYANGLTINEAETLKVGTLLDLSCIGFRLDSYSEDMSVTCSLFKNLNRFIAVNNIQHEEAKHYIDKILSSEAGEHIKLLESNIDQKMISEFNSNCNVIDSINYSHCLDYVSILTREASNKQEFLRNSF